MKKVFLNIVLLLFCFSGLSQGRISFQTDSVHLVYYQDMPGRANGDPVWAGSSGPYTLMADLYLGTASDSLSLISSTTFSSTAPGKWNTVNIITAFPGGTAVFVITQIRDATQTPPAVWTPFTYPAGPYGVSQEFQFILGTSAFTYPPMYNQGTTAGTGNWAPGTQNMDNTSPGFRGAVAVGLLTPEPSALSLVILGTTAMLLRRMRRF